MKKLETNAKCIKMEILERVNMYLMEKNDPNIKINKYSKIQEKEEYDVILSSGSTFNEEICEIKTRYYYASQFNNYILEKRKFDSLTKNNDDFLYVMFFKDNVLIWRLHAECEYEWEDKEYKRYACRESGMEIKKCLMLSRADCIVDEPIKFTYEQAEELALNHFNKKYKHLTN